VLALFVVAWTSRCVGADAPIATPAPEPAGAGQGEGLAEGSATGPAAGARPCDAYVAEAMRCAREEAAALDQPLPDDAEVLEGYLREGCRTWLRNGVSTGDLAAALGTCKSVSCAEGGDAWSDCVVGALPSAPPSPPGGRLDPDSWARIEPRPIPSDRDPCDVMVDWMVDCTREAMGASGLGPDIEESLRHGLDEGCATWRTVPEMVRWFPIVLANCADVGCGAGGADLMTCIAMEIAEAATAAAGASESVPEPVPEPAPGPVSESAPSP
jgi:hypothetical protein